jgi:hypothetical protein
LIPRDGCARLPATTMRRSAREPVRHQLANVQSRERPSFCRGERNNPAKSPHQGDRTSLLPDTVRTPAGITQSPFPPRAPWPVRERPNVGSNACYRGAYSSRIFLKNRGIHHESASAKPFGQFDVLATPPPHRSKAIQDPQALDRAPGGPSRAVNNDLLEHDGSSQWRSLGHAERLARRGCSYEHR